METSNTETVTREQQREEALKRLKKLNLHPNVAREFEQDGKVNVSERMRLASATVGILYWADEKTREVIGEFEREHNAVVYHATHESTTFGELLDLLFVSEHVHEWEMDEEELLDGEAFVYTVNLSSPELSEFGSIGIRGAGGGLVRTW